MTLLKIVITRSGSRAAATFQKECFVIIANKPLTIITKRSILDVAAVLDPPLITTHIIQLNSCNSNPLGVFGNLFELGDFLNYRIYIEILNSLNSAW